MPYADLSDVQARLPRQIIDIGPSSQPTEGDVAGWLEEATRFIDAALRWRYVVPVTHADDVAILRPICAQLVVAQIWGHLAGHDAAYADVAHRAHRRALELLAWDGARGKSLLLLPKTAESTDGAAAAMVPMGSFTDPDIDGPERLFDVTMSL